MADTVPLQFSRLSDDEMRSRASEFSDHLRQRRTVRDFSADPIPDGVLDACLLAAGSAPNGANLQPWHFAVVRSPDVKRRIREAAEEEEREFYGGRAPQEWLDTLAHLGTNAEKPFLETAPALIAVFQQSKTTDEQGRESKTYYPKESVGLATGFLIAALHQAGLATLTHTPSPMNFLNEILKRPATEKPFLLLVVGYPAENCRVPDIKKKPLDEIRSVH
ncbi:nitroreductase family protein [Sulfuriroseicoccus oceanibius]|uniref:Nitroreductase family protein n=1 Tax=Sulfuriroseicoccus oceanibius TaxID=2707525 RepID=A0A6B3LCP1_9BACT|nr:nitroreductase family protein [Sulfuriroseicoccus oceanibius]QQL45807.1 nitroreductase family protein [Sulfuriroseicoccus oceanibius]